MNSNQAPRTSNRLIIKTIKDTEILFKKKKKFWDVQYSEHHKKYLGFKNYDWSDDIYLPLEKWFELYDSKIEKMFEIEYSDLCAFNKKNMIAHFATISAWRHSQGIYVLDQRVINLIENQEIAECVSANHINGIDEWAIYIPMDNKIGNIDSVGVFISKNTWIDQTEKDPKEKKCIILNFNQINTNRSAPLPYILVKTDQDYKIEESVIDLGGFGNVDADEIITALKKIFGAINICFDPLTKIESNIVGVKKPHYSDVDFNINFNDFNMPTFKYLSPSNLREWVVGLNYLADVSKYERTHSKHPNKTLKWLKVENKIKLIDLLENKSK